MFKRYREPDACFQRQRVTHGYEMEFWWRLLKLNRKASQGYVAIDDGPLHPQELES